MTLRRVRPSSFVRRARRGERRGSLLLEVMLALAIFVMAGTAILSLVGGTMEGMGRMKLSRQAADLARSAMAKIEAGIETPQTLNGPVRPWSAEGVQAEGGTADEAAATPWELQIETEPTQFRGLSKVTVKAVLHEAGGSDRAVASYTLRQLVRLSGKGEERVGEEDALASEAKRGLPAGGAAPQEKQP